MKKHFHALAMLAAALFSAMPIYGQFDAYNTLPNPDYSSSPERLKKFVKDSIEEHQKTIVNFGTPYKYCLPHVCINRKGKYALIGFDHRSITPFEFDNINGDWHDNAYLVRKGNLYGCIDGTGKELVAVNYPQVHFSNPGLLITTGKDGLLFDRQGKNLLPEKYQYLKTLILGRQTVIVAKQKNDDFLSIFNLKGEKLNTIAGFDIESINHVTNNQYAVKVSPDFYTKMKVVDSNLVEMVPPVFRYVTWANEKWVFGQEDNPDNKGLYNVSEKKYYRLPYEYIHEPSKDQSGFVVGTDNQQYGIMDNNLKEVLSCQFSSIEQLQDKDLFIVRTSNNSAGLTNAKGQFILDTIYFNIWPVMIPEPISRENIRSNPTLFPGSKPLPTDFLRLADHEGRELFYQIDKNTFLKGNVNVLTPDLYIQRLDDGKDRLMHHDGSLISMIENIWKAPTSMVVVQKESNSTRVHIYDRSGKLLKELASWPKSVEIPYREFYTWTDSNGKAGMLDPNFSAIIEPQYDAIYKLNEIPKQFTDVWVKYSFQNLEHSFLGWIWNTDKTVPLLIKENGEVVSIVELK